ncbi:TrmH family RNA methyltransferase [Desulfoplanes formicivorans]|uniref:tRNA (guanosine(18)-2'-O)-methyltransferase n=1 Tax=Desulfoplanes formicivorans TaxID=1592317 RepID=A0A194AKV0_9BACT|nr:TrmH family RNA methyltransferase [Desulfoplanes formicivorans]GAU09943.1 tRNA methyltransferase [Desulfoplanes formicivorans]
MDNTPFLTDQRRQRIEEVLAKRQKDLTLIINNVHDPHNVAAILRSCDAFGVYGVHLYYTKERFPAVGKRSSASARKWIARTRHQDAGKMISGLRSKGYQCLGTGFGPTARPVHEWDFTKPTAIVLGNEHRGMDQDIKMHVPDEIYIPMVGMVQSLNVSVAAAIILYEAWRQRKAAGMFDQPSFSKAELEQLRAQWASK